MVRYRNAGTQVFEDTEHESVDTERLDSRNGYDRLDSERDFDTWYQNQTGADLDVIASARSLSNGTSVSLELFVNSEQTENAYISRNRHTLDSVDEFSVSATVPSGSYYKINANGDTADYILNRWVEQA